MVGDTVDLYRGREAEWAALCAMDGLEASEMYPNPSEAAVFIEGVWEFVVASCEEEGVSIPDREQAIARLAEMLQERREQKR